MMMNKIYLAPEAKAIELKIERLMNTDSDGLRSQFNSRRVSDYEDEDDADGETTSFWK